MIATLLVMILAADAACPPPVTLAAGTAIPVVTAAPLTSKTAHTGDPIDLVTSHDVVVDGMVVIPKGTIAHGQIAEAHSTGGLGVGGKLTLRPLYLTLGDTTVRLTGSMTANGEFPVGSAIGIAAATPFMSLSGISAKIAAQTPVPAAVLKSVTIGQCPLPK